MSEWILTDLSDACAGKPAPPEYPVDNFEDLSTLLAMYRKMEPRFLELRHRSGAAFVIGVADSCSTICYTDEDNHISASLESEEVLDEFDANEYDDEQPAFVLGGTPTVMPAYCYLNVQLAMKITAHFFSTRRMLDGVHWIPN